MAELGVSPEQRRAAVEDMENCRSKLKGKLTERKNWLGFRDGWQGMDGGIMSFRGILETVSDSS